MTENPPAALGVTLSHADKSAASSCSCLIYVRLSRVYYLVCLKQSYNSPHPKDDGRLLSLYPPPPPRRRRRRREVTHLHLILLPLVQVSSGGGGTPIQVRSQVRMGEGVPQGNPTPPPHSRQVPGQDRGWGYPARLGSRSSPRSGWGQGYPRPELDGGSPPPQTKTGYPPLPPGKKQHRST